MTEERNPTPSDGTGTGQYQPEPSKEQVKPQPVSPEQPKPEGGLETKNFVTKADLEAYGQQLLREAQRAADTGQETVRRKLSEQIQSLNTELENLKAAGASDTDVAFVRQQRMAEIARSTSGEPGTADVGSQPPVRPEPGSTEAIFEAKKQLVNENLQALEKQGLAVTPQDPEFAKVNFNDPDPDRFWNSYQEAYQARAKRLNINLPTQQAGEEPKRTAPELQMTSLGGIGSPAPSNPIADITDPHELFRIGKQQEGGS